LFAFDLLLLPPTLYTGFPEYGWGVELPGIKELNTELDEEFSFDDDDENIEPILYIIYRF
jgi:hypothetical protein